MEKKVMELFFEDSSGNMRKLMAGSMEECYEGINKFLDEHHYKSYYQNITKFDDGSRRVDVGSHTEFFHIKPKEGE